MLDKSCAWLRIYEISIIIEDVKSEVQKKSIFRKWVMVTLLLIVVILFLINFAIISSSDSGQGFFGQLGHLITSRDRPLRGEEEDRINILLLGTGGEGHEGPNLTDTIILTSFRPSDKRVTMLSIPRDLLVEFSGYGLRKINHVYALSEVNDPGSGGKVASLVVTGVFDIPIHYYVRVDFDGFAKLIDDFGGITVNVENTLEDPYYPILGKETATTTERYEHLVIEKGIRRFNGQTALQYVRSRRAVGIEGSDFARSQRQEKVLLAIKEKALSLGTLFNPNRIVKITKTLKSNIDTNLEAWEIPRLYSLAQEVKSEDIKSYVLDDSEQSPLKVYSAEDAYFLTTKTGDYSELREIAQSIFDDDLKIQTTVEEKLAGQKTLFESEYEKQALRIEVHNGTKINGLGGRISQFLQSKNYSVINIKNAPIQTYKKTLLYDLRTDLDRDILQELNSYFNAIIFTSGPPAPVIDEHENQIPYEVNPATDVLIIVGEDMERRL